MNEREALKLALEALQWNWGGEPLPTLELQAINAIKEVLAQPEQEPVAWRTFDGEGNYEYRDYDMNENYAKEWAERNPNHAHWVQPLIVKE